jgi:predicted MFS family arabinose efflux permease
LALLAVGLETVALTSTLWVTLAAVVVVGYSLPLTFIAFMTMLQRRTPHELMGRASAAVETIMGAPQAISLAVGALLVTLLDYHVIFAIMAAFTGAAGVYLLVSLRGRLFRPRHLRDHGRLHRRGRRLPVDLPARSVVSTGSPIDEPTAGACPAVARGARVGGGLIRLAAGRR